MKTRAGRVLAGALSLSFLMPAVAATAQELSEMAVKSFMDFAWSLTPQQFSKPDGTVIQIDKKKREEVMIPIDIARDVIKVGRLSAHAQVCDLADEQIANHRSMMRREEARGKWTPQQMVYISQLHLTTVMLLTGKIKLVEKQGDKEVVVEEEKKGPAQTCSDEQRKKVKELITAYVQSGPPPAQKAAGADPDTTTGSTAKRPTASAAPAPSAPKK